MTIVFIIVKTDTEAVKLVGKSHHYHFVFRFLSNSNVVVWLIFFMLLCLINIFVLDYYCVSMTGGAVNTQANTVHSCVSIHYETRFGFVLNSIIITMSQTIIILMVPIAYAITLFFSFPISIFV